MDERREQGEGDKAALILFTEDHIQDSHHYTGALLHHWH